MQNRPPSILIVDDEGAVRESLTDYFEDRGWPVASTDTAETALEMLKATRPDAVIVDIRLPGQDGNAFIRQAAAAYPRLAFIVVTGSPDYDLPADVAAMPCVTSRVFDKPVMALATLAQSILDHIDDCRAREGANA